jgi:hypothetical protein
MFRYDHGFLPMPACKIDIFGGLPWPKNFDAAHTAHDECARTFPPTRTLLTRCVGARIHLSYVPISVPSVAPLDGFGRSDADRPGGDYAIIANPVV